MTTEEQNMELESLGFSVKKTYEIDAKEVDDLINILKMSLWKDYKDTYNEE
jgi:hypothetical protein